MSDVRPFLSTIPSTGAPRSLGSALVAVPTAPATSPWSPRGAEPAATIDTRSIEDAARAQGREQGLAETAELRAQLAKAIAAFTSAREALKEPAADKIAAAAATVVSAWTETATPAELYTPIVRAWLAKTSPGTAHVAPAHVDELKAVIGDAPIEIVADAAMRPGDLRLSSATLELTHQWDAKLVELRDAIAAALEKS